MKAILEKLERDGWEALSDEEKAQLKAGNLQKTLDDTSAAARRKAEERLAEAEAKAAEAAQKAQEAAEALEAKENEGKPELERLKAENERLKAQIAERDTKIADLEGNVSGLTREAKLSRIIAKAKIAFVPKVDGEAMMHVLKSKFGELSIDDLDDDGRTAAIVDEFKSANEAIIADTSGHGSGGDPAGRVRFRNQSIKNPWKKETRNLTLQGQIQMEDPELAKRLKAEAAA